MFSKLKKLIKSKGDDQEKPDAVKQKKQVLDKKLQQDKIGPSSEPEKKVVTVPTEKKKKRNFTKKGIRRLDSDEEMLAYFGVENETAGEAGENKHLQSKRIHKQSERAKERKTDKHGFPVIDSSDNLLKMMEQNDASEVNDTAHDDQLKTGPARSRSSLKDKHGIPILSSNEDYQAFLNDDENQESFADILERSLGEKSTEVLLREKRDPVGKRKPMTLKKKLSRYPLPQGQLDLHGYTSMKADIKTESYLKNAFHQGTYTVRIIVGKGLHSEAGAVLPDVVEERIIRLRHEKIVLAYEWDNKKKSKSGALTVYLNNIYQV